LIRLGDDRILGISALGDPAAHRLVLLFPPTPGAGGFDPDPLLTERWGVQLLTLDRPGYAASSPLPDGVAPSVTGLADAVADWIEQSADDAERITTSRFSGVSAIGWGEGGAYAAVLAARHPGLVERLALVGTPRPTAPGPYRTRQVSMEALRIRADDPNLALPGVADRLRTMLEAAGLQGTAGVRTDSAALAGVDWGEGLDRLQAETLLVYGDQDPLAGPVDGRWFERRIPRARLHPVAGTGLLAIVGEWERILDHVAPQHGHLAPDLRDAGTPQIERDPRAWSGQDA